MNRRGFLSAIPLIGVPIVAPQFPDGLQPKAVGVLAVPQLYCTGCGAQLWQAQENQMKRVRESHTILAWCLNDSEFHPCPLAHVQLEVKLQTLPAKEVKDGNR